MKWHHLAATVLLLLAAQARADDDLTSPGEQARDQGVKTCLPMVEKLAKFVTDGSPHYSISSWNTKSSNTRLFNSQIVIKYTDGHSVGVINASPVAGGKCDGTYTTVTTTADSCVTARETTFKGWKFYADAAGLATLENDSGSATIVLLPDDKGGCVAIRTEVLYDTPKQTP